MHGQTMSPLVVLKMVQTFNFKSPSGTSMCHRQNRQGASRASTSSRIRKCCDVGLLLGLISFLKGQLNGATL